LSIQRREFKKLIHSRFTPFSVAVLVAFHCFVLSHSSQHEWTVVLENWPNSLPQNSNVSPHLRGYPFVLGSDVSNPSPFGSSTITRYHLPGVTLNILVAVLISISSYFLIDAWRKREFTSQFSVTSCLQVTAGIAVFFSVALNTSYLDRNVFPHLNLVRATSSYQYLSICFFFFGFSCFCICLGCLLTFVLGKMFRTLIVRLWDNNTLNRSAVLRGMGWVI